MVLGTGGKSDENVRAVGFARARKSLDDFRRILGYVRSAGGRGGIVSPSLQSRNKIYIQNLKYELNSMGISDFITTNIHIKPQYSKVTKVSTCIYNENT